ncbi:flagellar biosynthesis repressor FlbT [Profundibacterium mesophilum]|uniref:Flagellum biosynthesis repressor protein FlbT n=1 Tax=Profundibacterium mesophilum KAUST100406-0324 TaxID=1037889 RepID=A0A921NT47_9RHOB|nr:flagellar biosynthesis repressor FlbT [Profundibacterium mesophilum]KAF0674636.1 Flagellum biosynthesis repressor protein FlbT [Profundibacterium mesophilum KAUST100406-0324]
MALKLTLKPDEKIIVNGCEMRNSSRRHVMIIESHADVVRGHDLLDEGDAATPVSRVYYLIQCVLVRANLRDKLVPVIQKDLATLATIFGGSNLSQIFEAASFVSLSDYYKALRALRPVMRYEAELLTFKVGQAVRDDFDMPAPPAAAPAVSEYAR